MTEAEWLASDDPGRMLEFLRGTHTGLRPAEMIWPQTISARKLRLYACACCRLAEPVLQVEQIDRWERDGHPQVSDPFWARNWADVSVLPLAVPGAGLRAALLRCLAGNPWRPVVRVATEEMARFAKFRCLGPMPAVVMKMARALYDARDWAALPVLADALEEAGCPAEEPAPEGWFYCRSCGKTWKPVHKYDDCDGGAACEGMAEPLRAVPNPLLAHLRGPGPHARGCWALDLILGKE